MTLELSKKMAVSRDTDGAVRSISHPTEPFYGTEAGGTRALGAESSVQQSPRDLAESYLREMLPNFGVDASLAEGAATAFTESRGAPMEAAGQQLNVTEEKVGGDKATVSFAQTVLGLPVWQAGFSVRMRKTGDAMGVVGSTSTVDPTVGDVQPPSPAAKYLPDRVDADTLKGLLNIDAPPQITSTRLLIYRYDVNDQGNAVGTPQEPDATEASPTLNSPPVPASIEQGKYYVVSEFLFGYTAPGWGPLNWRAFVEPETGAVLRLEALVSCVDGMVLLRDPITATGVNVSPTAPAADLDALCERVELPEIENDGQVNRLSGPFVRIVNVSAPDFSPPTVPLDKSFEFSVTTDDFAAVNGYYHCDRCFRTVEELGFDVQEFFDGTSFPVRVDHRATINGATNIVNAQAPGNATSRGSDGFRFALLAPNATIGMAVEARVTWHEFGHAILWDHLHSPNFRFAHSPGDTIAAIMLAPDSKAEDPGATFPWTIITRRHDHEPSSGFAWGGSQDVTQPVGQVSADTAGYRREQILSSTMWRFYQACGGASDDVEVRRRAARRTVWLLLETISTLSPVAQPQTAEDLFGAMVEAELLGSSPVEPFAAGLLSKVLRYAFERQGLFQPPGAPSPAAAPGAPPAIDVLIDDGRGGRYEPTSQNITEPPALRVRRQADGGVAHERPAQGQPAFVYVTVANRGSQTAEGVTVTVSVRRTDVGDEWPGDWTPLVPSGAGAGVDVAPGASVTVGPFAWTPEFGGEWSIFADADCEADPSIVRSTFSGSCPAATIAMFDNNAAIRRVDVEAAIV